MSFGFNHYSGNNIHYTLPDELSHLFQCIQCVNVILRGNPEHFPVRVIKTVLKHGFQLVRPALNSPYHRYLQFKFLPIGRESRMEARSDLPKGGRGGPSSRPGRESSNGQELLMCEWAGCNVMIGLQ